MRCFNVNLHPHLTCYFSGRVHESRKIQTLSEMSFSKPHKCMAACLLHRWGAGCSNIISVIKSLSSQMISFKRSGSARIICSITSLCLNSPQLAWANCLCFHHFLWMCVCVKAWLLLCTVHTTSNPQGLAINIPLFFFYFKVSFFSAGKRLSSLLPLFCLDLINIVLVWS